ncbi:MAG: hypothetical protein QW227_01685 [Candidatus Aenigmatarchaeota archaeon]
MFKGKVREEPAGKGKILSVDLEREEDIPKFISKFMHAVDVKNCFLDLRKKEGTLTYSDFFSSSDEWWNGYFVDFGLKFSNLIAKLPLHAIEGVIIKLLELEVLDFILHTDALVLRFHHEGYLLIGIKCKIKKIKRVLSGLIKT